MTDLHMIEAWNQVQLRRNGEETLDQLQIGKEYQRYSLRLLNNSLGQQGVIEGCSGSEFFLIYFVLKHVFKFKLIPTYTV